MDVATSSKSVPKKRLCDKASPHLFPVSQLSPLMMPRNRATLGCNIVNVQGSSPASTPSKNHILWRYRVCECDTVSAVDSWNYCSKRARVDVPPLTLDGLCRLAQNNELLFALDLMKAMSRERCCRYLNLNKILTSPNQIIDNISNQRNLIVEM